jgi:purine-cytosine permease-like protein
MTAQRALLFVAPLMMGLSCAGVVASISIGHTVLTVLFAVLAMVFHNLYRWHKRAAAISKG